MAAVDISTGVQMKQRDSKRDVKQRRGGGEETPTSEGL